MRVQVGPNARRLSCLFDFAPVVGYDKKSHDFRPALVLVAFLTERDEGRALPGLLPVR